MAHLIAGRSLLDRGSKVSGQVYFLTDGRGTNFFSFFDPFVEGAGYRIKPKNLWLPRWFALVLGGISELMALLLRPVIDYRPKLSRFAVVYTCTDYTFSSAKATKDFGFMPKYSADEAFKKTVSYFKKQA
jgi:nucleoside-diphosphate-sugar epimerase